MMPLAYSIHENEPCTHPAPSDLSMSHTDPPPPNSSHPAQTSSFQHAEWHSSHDGSPLTQEDILLHNQSNKASFWKPWKGKVYDTHALCKYYEPMIESKFGYALDYDLDHVIINLPLYGIKKAERDQALEMFFVAPLVKRSDEEKMAEYRDEVRQLLHKLSLGEEETSGYEWTRAQDKSMLDICQRELQKAISKCTTSNETAFHLPFQVDASSLRSFLKDWEKFNCEIGQNGYAWEAPIETESIIGDHLVPEEYLREWLSRWEQFDLSIGGEASWEVMPLDVVKDDVTTELQEAVLKSRMARPGPWDEKTMAKRREALLAYFMNKYEMDSKSLEPFRQWANSMRESAATFKKLCD